MVTIDVTSLGGLRCEARHGPSQATLLTDAPVDNHGQGRSFSPTDLVATALGTCVLTVMDIVAQRQGLSLQGASAQVEKQMHTGPGARRIGRLLVTLQLPAVPDDAVRARLEAAAHHCPVHASLRDDVEVEINLRWG